MKIHLYSGAGNTFTVLDGRDSSEEMPDVVRLCRKYATDGLMILRTDAKFDFSMDYYNSDGSGGMMCGNGGRCIVAFADFLGITPSEKDTYRFLAADGEHSGTILKRDGRNKTVRLKMCDVHSFAPSIEDGYFLDTGTRHYVKFVEDVEAVDLSAEGSRLRHHPAFAPAGANANFVQIIGEDTIKVRTFEKGVEAETLACGTGVTASAIASYLSGKAKGCKIEVHTRKDIMEVEFNPSETEFTEVYLTGPTTECSEAA